VIRITLFRVETHTDYEPRLFGEAEEGLAHPFIKFPKGNTPINVPAASALRADLRKRLE